MDGNIIYRHTNINSKDWKALAKYYETVFGLTPTGPERDICGEWIEKVTGIKGVHIRGQHMAFPGYEAGGPTLEIFTYNIPDGEETAKVNSYGFAHIAFEVDDVEEVYKRALAAGGSACGELLEQYYPSVGKSLRIIYSRDPEGNVVEIMKWID